MASVSERSGKNSVAGSSVAGYFANGEDARRAIDALTDKGFDVREIGAAFHSRARQESMLDVEEEPVRRVSASDRSIAGVASGSGAVTPSGLSTGGGTGIAGAGRPGSITGGELPSDLPREIPRMLPTNAQVRSKQRREDAAKAAQSPNRSKEDKTSWRERLEPLFGGEGGASTQAESQKFGTGEGHLGDVADYAYSSSAFEQSFTGMGIPVEHARRVAEELQRGGAVLTVNAGPRAKDAETIMLQNHGVIRYEGGAVRRAPASDRNDPGGRVEIFGEIHRVYPNYVPRERQIGRKAS